MHLSIGQAAILLGVSITTLRRWEKEGILTPSFRTPGGHRRFALTTLEALFATTSKFLQALLHELQLMHVFQVLTKKRT